MLWYAPDGKFGGGLDAPAKLELAITIKVQRKELFANREGAEPDEWPNWG